MTDEQFKAKRKERRLKSQSTKNQKINPERVDRFTWNPGDIKVFKTMDEMVKQNISKNV